VRVGEVLGEAWQLYRSHWRHFVSIALAVYLLIALATLLPMLLLGLIGLVAAALVQVAGVFWLQGALVVAVEDVRDGRADLTIGQTLAGLRKRINTLSLAALTVLVVGAAAGALLALGLLLYVIPGLVVLAVVLFLVVRWSLLVPVIMLEGKGVFGAARRSRELVRGSGWAMLGVIVLSVVFMIIVSIVIAIALVWLPDWLQGFVITLVGGSVTAPFAALAWTIAYHRLRSGREPAAA